MIEMCGLQCAAIFYSQPTCILLGGLVANTQCTLPISYPAKQVGGCPGKLFNCWNSPVRPIENTPYDAHDAFLKMHNRERGSENHFAL